jgi:hypothetical protein
MKENPIFDIMNLLSVKTARRICNFLKKCFDIRKERLQHNNN